MRKKKNLFIVILVILASIFLFGCNLINTNTEDTEYKLIYKTEGNGYVVCEYDNNARIKSGTSVSLQAVANTGSLFEEWIDADTNESLSKSDSIVVKMNKKVVLIAKFKLEKTNDNPPDEDNHTKLKDLSEGKDAFIKARVVVTFKNGFVIKDETAYALCYLGKEYKYSCGDIIEFNTKPTTYKGNLQITELVDCKRVGYSLPTEKVSLFNEEDISTFLESPL